MVSYLRDALSPVWIHRNVYLQEKKKRRWISLRSGEEDKSRRGDQQEREEKKKGEKDLAFYHQILGRKEGK